MGRLRTALVLLPFLLLSGRAEADCERWSQGEKIGKIEKKKINEASGLAASRNVPGVLWTMNDDKGDRRLFALDKSGNLLAEPKIATQPLDWEALSMGPCRDRAVNCLYVGDIGSDAKKRNAVLVLRFPEPRIRSNGKKFKVRGFEVARFAYADGKKRDAEALLVDSSGTLWIFDKSKGSTSLFRAEFARGLTPGATLDRVATRSDIEQVTGADLAPDGLSFLVRDRERAYEFFVHRGSDIATAFRGRFRPVSLRKERQGEAIAFSSEGKHFFTLSEGKRTPIYQYERLPTCR